MTTRLLTEKYCATCEHEHPYPIRSTNGLCWLCWARHCLRNARTWFVPEDWSA